MSLFDKAKNQTNALAMTKAPVDAASLADLIAAQSADMEHIFRNHSLDASRYGKGSIPLSGAISRPTYLAPPDPRMVGNETFRHRILCERMRVREGDALPFEWFGSALSGDVVHVFVVKGGKAITIEDDANLYPSDALVASLLLISTSPAK